MTTLLPRHDPWLERYGTCLALLTLVAFFALTAPNFASPGNLLNVLRQVSFLAILAVGFTLALIVAELDLSFANICSFAAVAMGALLYGGWPIALGLAVPVAIGLGFGLANGIAVTRFKIPSLIATLATGTIANGAAFLLTGGVAFVGRLPDAVLALGRGAIAGVPVLVVWMIAVAALAQFVVRRTRLGAHMLATGEAEDAARLAGIDVARIKLLGLALSGGLAGLTAVLLVGALSTAAPTMAYDFLMRAIAAVLLGMTTIEPGRPNVPGTLVGVLMIGSLTNGLVLMGAPYFVQDIVLGVIILGAVGLAASRLKRAAFGLHK
ncbi:MAG: ABC transporter permease [Alphaproteobacteria bacterium]|nr:ABC transporter permease [Alphaproteobacteria bacterium]